MLRFVEYPFYSYARRSVSCPKGSERFYVRDVMLVVDPVESFLQLGRGLFDALLLRDVKYGWIL